MPAAAIDDDQIHLGGGSDREGGEEIPERTVSLAIHGQGLGDHSPARACAGLNCPSLILEFFNI